MCPSLSTKAADDIDRRFREAVALHQSGQIAAAAAAYEQLRHQVPAHSELLYLLGTALVQLGRAGEAIPILDRSLTLRPHYAPTLETLGAAWLASSDAARAIPFLKEAISLQPQSPVALTRLGEAHAERGENDEARDLFQRALAAAPRQLDAAIGLATAEINLGEMSSAEDRLRRCIADAPTFARAYVVLGTMLAQQDRFAEAEQVARGALGIKPSLATAHHLLAKTLHRQGQRTEAEDSYRAALSLGQRDAAIHGELGELLLDAGRLDEGETFLHRALATAPESPKFLTALGRAKQFRGALDDAIALHNRAITADAALASAYVNRGTAKRFAGDLEGALADFNHALTLKPALPAAIASRGLALLAAGRLREGWPDYKARINATDGERDLSAGRPWDGTPLDGKRVLVWTEQGLGDEIMAASMLPEIVARTAHCTIACSPRLVPIFRRAFPGATVVTSDIPVNGDFDAGLPLLNAALWLRPTLNDFPARRQYLTADKMYANQLRARYGADKHKLVGISWHSAAPNTGAFKTTRLDQWANILKVPGIQFVSLQYGDAIRDANGMADVLIDKSIDPTNGVDVFAAQVDAMDLIISVSNSTVHVAGALGKPTWLLAPEGQGAHWYWFKDRDDSPWYPSFRIFRQSRPGDWDPVFTTVAEHLRAWLRT